jgi:hypothetical protein
MCSKDDKTVAKGILPTQVNTVITDGVWHIALYNQNGVDLTSDYSVYSFLFDIAGVVSATAAVVQDGTWNATAELGVTKLRVNFVVEDTESQLDSVSKDWSVLTATATKIEMKYVNEDESIDYLTLEKI